MVEYGNIFLVNGLGQIGGIETYLYEIGKKYGEYDITVLYQSADQNQLKRLQKYVRVERLYKKVKCKKCFLMYNAPIDLIEAEEYIQVIHANYKIQNYPPNLDKRITSYYGVSKWVAKAYEELLKEKGNMKKVDVAYNPITVEKPKRVLKLVSATRLSTEKGKDRMIKLAKLLEEKEIPFIWLVFTNDFEKIDSINVVYMKPRLDIRNYIAEADYLVQLSDTEGYPYSILESLCLGTPVITTPIPSIEEMRPIGYTLPFDMKNVPIEDIYNKIPKVKDYKPNEDIYDKLLDKTPSTYDPNDVVEVVAILTYETDNEWTMKGQRKFINKEYAKALIEEGKVKLV